MSKFALMKSSLLELIIKKFDNKALVTIPLKEFAEFTGVTAIEAKKKVAMELEMLYNYSVDKKGSSDRLISAIHVRRGNYIDVILTDFMANKLRSK